MLLLIGILLATLVRIKSSSIDLFKRNIQDQKTILEFKFNNDFLVFRLQQETVNIHIDQQPLHHILLFKAKTDNHIKGVFIFNHNQWQGSFQVNDTIHHLFPSSHPRALIKRDDHHYLTMEQTNDDFTCLTNHSHQSQSDTTPFRLAKRNTISCPTTPQVLPTCIAVDCNYYNVFQNATSSTILQEIGLASIILQQNINVVLGVSKIDIRTTCGNGNDQATWNNACTSDVQSKLDAFTNWRHSQSERCGAWHLITNCQYQPTLGVAYINTVCQSSNTGLSSFNTDGYKVVAHELLHTLGSVHDCITSQCLQGGSSIRCDSNACGCCPCDGCDCKGAYLMNPSLTVSTNTSACTKQDVCGNLPFANCLTQLEASIKDVGYCGNGIVEDDEECDPGVILQDQCCTSSCKLKPNAVCSDANQGCCFNCQIAQKNKICRQSSNECDVAQQCDGNSAFCPMYKYLNNGVTCSLGRCSNGICTNPDNQCLLKQRLGYIRSCSNSCSMQCMNNQGTCVDMGVLFMNGTTCQLNGICNGNTCTFNNTNDVVLNWINQNAIVVGLAVTTVVLLLMIGCYKLRKQLKGKYPPPTPVQ